LAAKLLYALQPTARTSRGEVPRSRREESIMTKIWAALLIVASLLLVAPIIESGTAGTTEFFQAVGTADGGGI
jgi:hypothetical protein